MLDSMAQAPAAAETPDPYFKGALEPIEVSPAGPQEITRAYNFQPSPLKPPQSVFNPIETAPGRVASNPYFNPSSANGFSAGSSTRPAAGPAAPLRPMTRSVGAQQARAAELWNTPNTPVSHSIQPPKQAASHTIPAPPSVQANSQPTTSPNVVPGFNGFSNAPIPFQNQAPAKGVQPLAPTTAAPTLVSPTVTPQSIIREQPVSSNPIPASLNQTLPNDFQPIQTPASRESFKTPPAQNDFAPDFSFKTPEPLSTNEQNPVQQASLISSEFNSKPLLPSPSQQLVKQASFVQPVMTPLKQQEHVVPFEAGKVVAIVGGEPIFVGDMLFEINQLIEKFIQNAPADVKERERQKMISQILPKFVEARLLYHGMLGQLPEGVDIDEVMKQAAKEFDSKAMPSMMEAAGVESMTQFDAYLRSLGSSLRNMRETWARDQMTKYFLSQKLTVDNEVTHEEMLEHYRENVSSYALTAKARWEQIMIRFDKSDSREAARSEISKLSNQVVHGANLAALAKNSSHGFMASSGGQQDWVSKGSLVLKELDDAIFKLPIGKLSGIIESRDGFHVVRVLERTEAGHTSFLEAQVNIKKKIVETKRKAAFDKHMAELRAQIPVEYMIQPAAIAKLNEKKRR